MSTPVKFKELTIQNFMSYGNNVATINLDFKEPILIIGRNHDAIVNGQIDSNGAGKSAILDALAFGLYDKTISNKDKASLINNINKKNLEVTVTFQKDGLQYKIIRMRKTKTKADVKLLVMGKDGEYKDKTPDSIANTNSEIERILGIPFDVFARIIVFSATFQPFLDLPSRHASKASQTSIMEELFGYTELTEKAESLKAKIKGTKSEFSHLQELQEQIVNEIKRQQSQIDDVESRISAWDENHSQRIKDTEAEIEKLSKIDLNEERKILSLIESSKQKLSDLEAEKRVLEAERKSLKKQIDDAEEKKEKIESLREKVSDIEENVDFDYEEQIIDALEKLEEKNEKISQEKRDGRKEKVSLKEKVDSLNNEIDSLRSDECPYCGQEYHDEDKIKQLIDDSANSREKISEIDKTIKALDEKLQSNSSKIEKAKKKSISNGSRSELNKMQAQHESQKTQLESYIEDELDESVYSDLEEKTEKVAELTEQIETEENVLKKASAKSSFEYVADIEKVAAKLESAKEKLEDISKEENPHHEILQKMEDNLADLKQEDDKSEKLNELEENLRHQEFLLKLLTKKDSFVRKNLLDRSLPFLNKRLMNYLEKLGLPHRVEFQPDMSANISQFGTELDFTSLSSGQRARVNLALAFAFRDVLQARHGKISFCMLDECLDTGLGNVGVQLAAKMIKEISSEGNMSMFVISHRDEIATMFKKQMIVELKNGFSNIDA